MKKLLLILALFSALCFQADAVMIMRGSGGWNSGLYIDSNCVAVWNLENGALGTDSKGTNTLTNSGVTADTGTYKVGAASGSFVRTDPDVLSITDANLNSGFPLKNGDSTKIISITAWFRLGTFSEGDTHYVVGKYDTTGKRSFAVQLNDSGTDEPELRLLLGYNSGDSSEILYSTVNDDAYVILESRWYHVGVTYDDADKGWQIRIWDDTAQSVVINNSGTGTNNINVEDADFDLGCKANLGGEYYTGLLDEVAIFKDELTTTEIDQIRQGIY